MKPSVLTVLWVNLGFSFIALHHLNIQLQQWLCKQNPRGWGGWGLRVHVRLTV